MYYDKSKLYSASDPFVLMGNGDIRYLKPDITKKIDLKLYRKYPLFKGVAWKMIMVKGTFAGSNNANFDDQSTLFKIKDDPNKFEDATVTDKTKYRYVKYILPRKKSCVAEIEFYGEKLSGKGEEKLTGKIIGSPFATGDNTYLEAMDSNLETYFTAESGYVGLDLGIPRRITRVRYCPRSDTNFIKAGDTYELCYWNGEDWVPLGKQKARDQFIEFKNVPHDALLILHDLDRGKEERIFTYENGNQIWW
jgi:hypothetical protein